MKYCCVLFLWLHTFLTYADVVLTDLLHTGLSSTSPLVMFEQINDRPSSLVRMRLHLLEAQDCYSGYLGLYDTQEARQPLDVIPHVPFGLSAEAVFEAGVESLGVYQVEQIHGVLIRLISDQKQFAMFTGACSDQGINCCLPVRCSVKTRRCSAAADLDIQSVIL